MKIDWNNNPSILNNYLNYLLGVCSYSIDTVEAYNSDLRQFFNFVKTYNQIPVSIKQFTIFILLKINKDDVIAFLVYLNFSKNNNPYTRQRKLSAIRSFYKWLLYTYPAGRQKENPTKTIPNIEKLIRIPRHLNVQQAKEIQNIFTLENTKFPQRNNAIISLFLNTGMRVSELIGINLRDISFKNNTIIVYGKGNKERKVYFSNSCKQKLLDYINYRTRKEKVIDISSPLFVNRFGKRIGIDGVEYICLSAYKLMGLSDCGYTTHTLRHTAATLMYIYVTEDILLIKNFLGHVTVTSTEIYTHTYSKKLKEAVDKHPLNNFEIEKAA